MAEISLRKARTIIKGTLAKGREMELNPLTVVLLDTGGNVKAVEREDGAAPGRFQIAYGKAYGVVMTGMTGSAQMARAEQQPYFVNALNGLYDGRFIAVPGGILIRDARGNVMGALGVTGDTSDNDAAAGVAGIEGANLKAEA